MTTLDATTTSAPGAQAWRVALLRFGSRCSALIYQTAWILEFRTSSSSCFLDWAARSASARPAARGVTRGSDARRQDVAAFYSLNTLGAMVACVAPVWTRSARSSGTSSPRGG